MFSFIKKKSANNPLYLTKCGFFFIFDFDFLMVQKTTILTNQTFFVFYKNKTICVYFKPTTGVFGFVKATPRLYFKKTQTLLKKKTNSIVFKTKKSVKRYDGSFFFFKNNSCLVFKKKNVIFGKTICGVNTKTPFKKLNNLC